MITKQLSRWRNACTEKLEEENPSASVTTSGGGEWPALGTTEPAGLVQAKRHPREKGLKGLGPFRLD